MAKKIRGVMFEENLNNSMGLEFYNLSHRFGYQSPNWPYFEDVKIERIHYMAKSGVLSQRITTSMHNTTHIDAPAHVVQGTPFIDEVPLPHFFGSGIVVSIPKKKWEPITYDDLEKAAGKIVRPRDVVIVNTGWHHQYEDSEDYFCRSPGLRAVGRRLVRREEGQGRRPRHPGQRPSARHRDRPAAQRPAASASRRRIQEVVGRPRLEGRFPGMGAGAPHPVQERHPRHRECRRRSRQGHRQALHLRVLPVELGPRRRLHHPPGRHHRSEGQTTASRRGRSSDDRPQALPTRSPTRRRTIATTRRCALFGAEMGGSQDADRSASRTSCRAAAPGRTPRRRRRSTSCSAGELTVIADGKETVLKQDDSCYIGPNESREIVNRGNEVCTIAVAVRRR